MATRPRLTLVPLLALLATACGAEDTTEVEVAAPADEATWSSEALGAPVADAETLLATRDGTAVVVTSAEGGGLAGWASTGGGPFEAVDLGPAVRGQGQVSAVAAGPAGFLAMGSAYDEGFLPKVWRSSDGRAWELVDAATGLDRPADVLDVAATDDGWVAVGALRTGADPASGPFAGVAWHSTDGTSWTLTELPPGADAEVRSVAAVGEQVVATGDVGGQPAAWRSEPGGSWERLDVAVAGGEGIGPLADVAARGDRLVATASAEDADFQRSVVVTSDDLGDSWTLALVELEVEYPTVEADADGFSIVGSRFLDSFASPEACYEDIDACRSDADPVVLRSTDGTAWEAIDVSDLGSSDYLRVYALAAADGRTLVLGSEERVQVWSWLDSAGPLPRLEEAPEPEPSEPPPPTAEYGGDLALDVTYRYPLYIHCGMDYLGEFNDAYWYREAGSGGPVPETGAGEAPPDNWPVAQQTIFGEATLVEPDLIEYMIPGGEVIARYAPSDRQPPGCD